MKIFNVNYPTNRKFHSELYIKHWILNSSLWRRWRTSSRTEYMRERRSKTHADGIHKNSSSLINSVVIYDVLNQTLRTAKLSRRSCHSWENGTEFHAWDCGVTRCMLVVFDNTRRWSKFGAFRHLSQQRFKYSQISASNIYSTTHYLTIAHVKLSYYALKALSEEVADEMQQHRAAILAVL